MSPSLSQESSSHDTFEDELNLGIIGVGVQYPPFHNGPEAVETLAERFYPESNPMKKTLSINRFTGIEARAAIGTADHPIVNQAQPPSIRELNELFMDWGVRLSTGACEQALADAGLQPADVTHMVSTTCTNSANPGYDHFVAKNLGLGASVEKVLLHGIGCSGGLAAIRTACNLALGARARGKRARVLVCACEISSVLVRSELESIHQNQEVRIGVCLFSDCASACVVSNGIGEEEGEWAWLEGSVYDILGWKHELIDDSAHDLGFDVDPFGWKVVLTPRVPSLTSTALPRAFDELVSSIPSLPAASAAEMDWALHPGGATILTGAQNAMGISEEHLQCSYEVYVAHGNSSSATILSVLSQERSRGAGGNGPKPRPQVLAAAFGPGITVELMMLRRGKRGYAAAGGTGASANGMANGHDLTNGTVNGAGVNGHPNGANGTNGSMAASGLHAADGMEPMQVGDSTLQPEELD